MSVVDSPGRPASTGADESVPRTVVNAVSAAAVPVRDVLGSGTLWPVEQPLLDWVFAQFGESPGGEGSPVEPPGGSDGGDGGGGDGGGGDNPGEDGDDPFDVESTLLALRAVTEREDSRDLRLTSHFQTAWREQVMMLRVGDAGGDPTGLAPDLAPVLDVDESDISVEADGEGYLATVDGEPVGQWPSRAAILADVGGANAFLDRQPDEWLEFSVQQRGQLLQGLRVFLEECPACDGPVVLSEDAAESARRSAEVFAVVCEDCGDRIVEVEQSGI